MTAYKEYTNEIFLFRLKDFYSAITHLIGFALAIIGMPILLCKVGISSGKITDLIACSIFSFSTILLYGASSAYHSFNISKRVNDILKKIDHMSIYILIAGTYTPICIIALSEHHGLILLLVIWILALLGIIFKYFFVYCPKWVSSVLYIAMGWACVGAVPYLLETLTIPGFIWLLVGGIFYTVGAIIYAKKSDKELFKGFGNHEVFHCFVLLGTFCHYIVIFNYLPFIS